MKISFSTLGCPDWTFNEILATAKDLSYDGVEIRGIRNEMYVPRIKNFSEKNIKTTLNQLKEKQIKISCLTSSCFLFDEDRERYLKEGKEYIDAASLLGVAYVRVLGDKDPEPSKEINIDLVMNMLLELANYSIDKNVVLLLETNGVFANTKLIKDVLDELNHPNIGVLWDIHHPFRYFDESISTSYRRIKKYLKHVHIKDSKLDNGKIKYCLLGEGEIPVKDSLTILNKDGYDGFVSLEWVKRWYYDLEEPGIVFSHSIDFIKRNL